MTAEMLRLNSGGMDDARAHGTDFTAEKNPRQGSLTPSGADPRPNPGRARDFECQSADARPISAMLQEMADFCQGWRSARDFAQMTI
jgi:hypothetical protein